MMAKWRGLTSEDLTDGLMQVVGSNPDGSTKVIMYNVPLVKSDGSPQPVAHMLEKNKVMPRTFLNDALFLSFVSSHDGL